MLRKVSLLVIALVLLVPACAGDDDDAASDTTAEETATTEEDGGAADDEGDDNGDVSDDDYGEAFAKSLTDGDDGFGLTDDEAQCATEKVIDEIGAERLQDAGMTEQYLSSQSGDPTDLTDEEARTIVDALFDCGDMGEAFGRSVAGDVEGDDITPEQAECFGDAIAEDDTFRDVMALSLQQGDDADVPAESAEVFVDLMFECFDFAEVFAESLEADGITVTEEQRDCLNDEMKRSDEFRQALISSLTGGEATDEMGPGVVLEMLSACGVDVLGASTGITS